MIFLEPDTEARTVAALADRLAPVVCWWPDSACGPTDCHSSATTGSRRTPVCSRYPGGRRWDGEPFEGGDYAVSVHRLMRSSAT